jgi:CheY-like chemotaxis protein
LTYPHDSPLNLFLYLYLYLTHSPVARKLLAIQVERVTGYRCEAAASGIEAVNIMLAIADRGVPTFDAVMIDYAMTHHSTLKEVRQPAPTCPAP